MWFKCSTLRQCPCPHAADHEKNITMNEGSHLKPRALNDLTMYKDIIMYPTP